MAWDLWPSSRQPSSRQPSSQQPSSQRPSSQRPSSRQPAGALRQDEAAELPRGRIGRTDLCSQGGSHPSASAGQGQSEPPGGTSTRSCPGHWSLAGRHGKHAGRALCGVADRGNRAGGGWRAGVGAGEGLRRGSSAPGSDAQRRDHTAVFTATSGCPRNQIKPKRANVVCKRASVPVPAAPGKGGCAERRLSSPEFLGSLCFRGRGSSSPCFSCWALRAPSKWTLCEG